MNSDVEEIKSKLNIVDVLSDYIRLDKAGANWRANCPFHNEKTPSFMVNEEKQIWHCFGCQKGGDVFSFVMEMEGLEFRETLKMLAEKAGVKLKSYNPQKTEEKNRTLEILELATKWYEHQLRTGQGQQKILTYLRERGLKDETIQEFRLGYAPDGWRNILTFLTSRGYKINEIVRTGLLVEKRDSKASFYDRFRDRIMFPIADYSGRVVGYSARVAPGADESQAKYVNTPETESYHKSRILYGIDKAKSSIKKMNWVLLVEGNMDVIAASQAGLKNTIAVSGTALTDEQIGIIKRYTKNIKMFFDMDNAGEAATQKSVKLCLAHDMVVKVVTLPAGKDAADVARENPKELLQKVSEAKNIMEYFFENTLTKYDKEKIEDRKKIVEDLLNKISLLSYDPDKNYWIKKLAESINEKGASIIEDEKALTNMLKKATLKNKITRFTPDEQKEAISLKSRSEVLLEEIIGLILVSKAVWKKASQKAKNRLGSFEDSLLEALVEKGERLNFDLEAFRREISADREKLEKLGRIYSQAKYQLDLNNNPVEKSLDAAPEDFELCLKELEKERAKKEMEKIAIDLKMAEDKKDRTAILFLRQELNNVSKKLAGLIN